MTRPITRECAGSRPRYSPWWMAGHSPRLKNGCSRLLDHYTPMVMGDALVINDAGEILLIQRADSGMWAAPGGAFDVGETAAEGAVRECHEETGWRVEPLALIGLYDSRRVETRVGHHVYHLSFLCRPLSLDRSVPSHAMESLNMGWFAEEELPPLDLGHRNLDPQRVPLLAWGDEWRLLRSMSETLIEKRQAIQHLLEPRSAADALASYYALYHPEERSTLVLHRDRSGRVDGFLALCRTGMDLFRPLLTLRSESEDVAAELLASALAPEAAVIIAVPLDMQPVIEAFFAVSGEVAASVYRLDRRDFQPVINVLVTRAPTPGGDPRFVIRGQSFDRGARPVGPTLAAAGVNWRSPDFGDIYVQTDPKVRGRGLGKSVVSTLCTWLLEQNVTPLYTFPDDNEASGRLASSLGFRDSGARVFLSDGVRRS